MSDAVASFFESLKKQPQLMFSIALVAVFLYYMDRRDANQIELARTEDMVTRQRIEQCHGIQVQSNEALLRLSTALDKQQATFERLSIAIEDLRRSINDHDSRIERLLDELDRHAREMERRGK